eukprot:TRINITY_DN37881_c0_g1_i1.p1 TRINITY_DN37881_c0_g1~~TRINITY_DN37881_c0_g1_i1.p1  ORF type:complete len:152 (+),score=17.52 TRINITY_DN37881_c0_g1_i1:145-600(+)
METRALEVDLFDAVARGQTDDLMMVTEFLPGRVHETNREGLTALHVAAEEDQAEAAQMLLDAHANPLAHNSKCQVTPLMRARELGQTAVTEALERAIKDKTYLKRSLTLGKFQSATSPGSAPRSVGRRNSLWFQPPPNCEVRLGKAQSAPI